MSKKKILIIGSLDTKGEDFLFLKQEIEKRGFLTFTIDVGVLGEPGYSPEISADTVALAGGTSLKTLREEKDRGKALETMLKGVSIIAKEVYATHSSTLFGVISLGGGGGTALATSAMRELPIGLPKIMVSTIASGDTAPYVQISDIVMVPAVVDVSGVNRISRQVYRKAVAMVCSAAEVLSVGDVAEDKPLIAVSMFGNTTKVVNHVRELLSELGYEVIVFHATGTGGRTMETLIRAKYFVGLLDITTTELADEVCGGVLSAGKERMLAAAETGIPQIIVPGCIDMCNFWGLNTVPAKYKDRKLYNWNPNVTLMRTNVEENKQIAKFMADKLNKSTSPVEIYIPLKGFSEVDILGGTFWSPEANNAFIKTLKKHIRKDIPIYELDYNINDPEFSVVLADAIKNLLKKENR